MVDEKEIKIDKDGIPMFEYDNRSYVEKLKQHKNAPRLFDDEKGKLVIDYRKTLDLSKTNDPKKFVAYFEEINGEFVQTEENLDEEN